MLNKQPKKRHFEERICKICKDTYQPSSANQKYCQNCKDKIVPYRKLKYGLGVCAKCGKKVEGLKRWCNDPECKKHKESYYKRKKLKVIAKYKEKADKISKDLENFKQIERNKKLSSNKKCRKCGKNPYPNILYCSSCLNSVSLNVDSREYSLIS